MATAPNPSSQPERGARSRRPQLRLPNLLHPGRLVQAPPIWRESRVAAEYVRLIRDPVFDGKDVPHGDGRPVLLIPGFLAGDSSMAVMAEWVRRIGYYSEMAGLTFNVRYSEVVMKALTARLHDVHQWKGRRVTLIGHSRGGILAKVLSHRNPELVEQVICLGSPIANSFDVHPVTMLGVRAAQVFNLVRYGNTANIERRFIRDLEAEARVPITSIYSRSDGIVHWEACLRDDVRSIEVTSSHVGLALNPEVYKIVARLLPWPERRTS